MDKQIVPPGLSPIPPAMTVANDEQRIKKTTNTMNFNNFTIKSQEAVQKGMEIAAAQQNQAIGTSHVLKGMLTVDENVIPYLLKKLNVNLDAFIPALDRILDSYPKVSGGEQYLSNEATKALQKATAISLESR
ncbi:MAG: Clp protease N-terminal domain-containing protein, partial [Methanoregula sp.]